MVGFGIDFGTTNSVAAVFDGRDLRAFVDDNELPHPSLLWYRGSGNPIVGRNAKDEIKNFANTPGNYFVKSIKSKIQQKTTVEIFGKYYSNQKIASEIFAFLKQDAKKYPNYPEITEAVVTIPLYFDGQQRKAIREAAKLGGVIVKSFIHEPFAAVVGYLFPTLDSLDSLKNLNENILVFDWGGGTLDITLVKLESGTISEISNEGYSDRAGDYFDEVLRNDTLDRFKDENSITSQELKIDDGIESILYHDIEFAKIDLSEKEKAAIRIVDFYSVNNKSVSLRSEISREQFELLIRLDIQDAMSLVDKVLHKARLKPSQIGRVLLIGGSSKIPLLDRMMRDTFGTTKVLRVDNADTVIAEGAAIISYYNWQPYLVNPICIQLSDDSYYTVFDKGTILKPEFAQKEIKLFCTDNRDGDGTLILADNLGTGRYQVKEPIIKVPVSKVLRDVYSEKIVADFRVDQDVILGVSARGSIKGKSVYAEFHDLCYGLRFA